MALVTIDTPTGSFALRHRGASPARAQVTREKATYPRALPGGRDVSIQLQLEGFKETVTVPNPHAGASYIVEMELPAGVVARDAEFGVEFVNEAGAVVANFGDGFAWDATFPESAASFTPVSVRLLSQDLRTASIEVAVDPAWLSDPERVFPVTIDPEFEFWQATQPGIAGPRDAFIYGAPEYANYGFDHILDTLWVGNYPRAAGRIDPTRTFMWFDLSSLPLSPAGGYVNWSYLVPYNEGYGQACTSQIIDLYRLKVPWGADLNWYTQPRDDQIEWFGFGNWKWGSSASPCPGAGYKAIETTLLAKMWLSGSPAYANHGLQLRARNEADPEAFKLFVAGDQPATNPNVPYFMVNYITPTLDFFEDTVYTSGDNQGVVSGTGYRPNTTYDIYFNNTDGSTQFLKSVSTDAGGEMLATLNLSSVRPPTAMSSTAYVHVFEHARGTDPLWCVSTDPVRVSTEERPPLILYHYSSFANIAGIIGSGWIDPTIGGTYGDGQYFTLMPPEVAATGDPIELSQALRGTRFRENDSMAFVAIDVSGLPVALMAPLEDQDTYRRDWGIWLHPSQTELYVADRIVASGPVPY